MAERVRNDPIPLDRAFLANRSDAEIARELRRLVRSVRFEYLPGDAALRLLGPDMSYHDVDPHLAAALKQIRSDLTPADVLSYHQSRRWADIYFEDSWTGYFIARHFEARGKPDEFVLIHLDDHTDMMATLMYRANRGLIEPTTGATFDPWSSGHWEGAIQTGAVNIANYLTPFYYGGIRFHVRHVNNGPKESSYIACASRCCEPAPTLEFADLARNADPARSCGTYAAGPDPHDVLNAMPRASVLVHVDLDYFINDFNGASRGSSYVPGPDLRAQALLKMDRLFDALRGCGAVVERWLIATSPGFCSGYHWPWLLGEIEQRVEASGTRWRASD
jgi:hypothetical protein